MRFIGGKSLLLDNILELISQHNDIKKVGDLFTGSAVVAQALKRNGYEVVSNDIMYMSYCLARGMTEFNVAPDFEELKRGVGIQNVFQYLNDIPLPTRKEKCFIYQNYSPNKNCDRMYFQNENALRIDAVRKQIEKWHRDELISEAEYFYLLASLLSAVPYVANITGVYAAYLKHWDKRTYNRLTIEPLEIIPSDKQCRSYNMDANKLVEQEEFDCVYIDTPYNQRQYTPNYHILETIARYDSPKIHGVTGMRDYEKSDYCSRAKVEEAFRSLFKNLKSKYAVVSYNNEGLLTTEQMISILSEFGKTTLHEIPYRRYKSKIPNETNGLKEQLYFVEMR